MDKKRKIIIGVSIAISLVILGGGALGFHNYSVKAEEKEQAQQEKDEIKAVKKEINRYFSNTKKENLAENVTKEDLEILSNKIKKLPKNLDYTQEIQTITKDFTYLTNMFLAKKHVDSLLDDQQVLVSGANIEMAQNDIDRLKDKKPVFVEEQQKIINEAKSQEKVIKEAQEKVNAFFEDVNKATIKSNVSRDTYNAAKEAVSKIKNKDIQANLTKELDKVNAYLTKKETAAKEKQETAYEQAAEKAQANENNNATSNKESSQSGQRNKEYSSNNNSGGNSSSSQKSSGSSSSKSYSSSSGSSNSGSTNKGSSSTSKSNGSSNKSSGSSSSGNSNSGSKPSSNGGSDNKTDYNTNDEGINGTSENQNGGSDISWGWN
ncbi:TPA: toxin Cry1Ac domain D-VI-related protein [Listeria monocytogenes]